MDPENKAQIQSNRRKIFELEILINSNKTKVEVCRASIEQNYASIMRNYNAAYMGNHHLANQETDEILRNRLKKDGTPRKCLFLIRVSLGQMRYTEE